MGSTLFLALLLASAAALAAAREPQPSPASGILAAPLDSTTGPHQIMPGATFPLDQILKEHAPAPAAPATAASSTVQAPVTAASSWSASPAPVAPAPVPPPEPAAARLARQAGERFGIRIVLDGQDWGPDEPSQETNIGAVISVMERLPQRVTSSVVSHPHGPLTFVSNQQGRTLDGWHPYGDFPMGFYTNSDRPALSAVEGGPDGSRPANEVVLIPGFSDMSIAHEVLHAYHFRNVGPDQYALALLGDEMRSFMAATGWRQLGSDAQVQAATADPWDVLNSLYVYQGRPFTYTSVAGSAVTISPPNPLEAFAVAGSIYYARPSGMLLPDWPDYWAWFQANLG